MQGFPTYTCPAEGCGIDMTEKVQAALDATYIEIRMATAGDMFRQTPPEVILTCPKNHTARYFA